MKMKPEVGQTLYMVRLYQGSSNNLEPVTVTKVGKKYFTVKGRNAVQFNLDTWCQKTDYTPDYTPDFAVYSSEQEYKDRQKAIELATEIFQTIRFSRLQCYPLEDLRTIKGILEKQWTKPTD